MASCTGLLYLCPLPSAACRESDALPSCQRVRFLSERYSAFSFPLPRRPLAKPLFVRASGRLPFLHASELVTLGRMQGCIGSNVTLHWGGFHLALGQISLAGMLLRLAAMHVGSGCGYGFVTPAGRGGPACGGGRRRRGNVVSGQALGGHHALRHTSGRRRWGCGL